MTWITIIVDYISECRHHCFAKASKQNKHHSAPPPLMRHICLWLNSLLFVGIYKGGVGLYNIYRRQVYNERYYKNVNNTHLTKVNDLGILFPSKLQGSVEELLGLSIFLIIKITNSFL